MSSDSPVEEVEYVDECPACGANFIGMTPGEFREQHAAEDCSYRPYTRLLAFPTPEALEELQ